MAGAAAMEVVERSLGVARNSMDNTTQKVADFYTLFVTEVPMRPPVSSVPRFMPAKLRLLIVIASATILWSSVARADIAVTTCGQELSGNGYLVGDLVCDDSGYAVKIEKSGKLDLRGFTISGGEYGVFCQHSCTVFGGGTVTGAEEDGIVALKTLKVNGITVTNNGFSGVKGGLVAIVTNATLTGNVRAGAQGLRRVKLIDTVSEGNGTGVAGSVVDLVRVSITGNRIGGALGDRVHASDSTIIDNHSGADCGVTLPCADIESPSDARKPRLKNVVCGTSYKGPSTLPGDTWGVCGDD